MEDYGIETLMFEYRSVDSVSTEAIHMIILHEVIYCPCHPTDFELFIHGHSNE